MAAVEEGTEVAGEVVATVAAEAAMAGAEVTMAGVTAGGGMDMDMHDI